MKSVSTRRVSLLSRSSGPYPASVILVSHTCCTPRSCAFHLPSNVNGNPGGVGRHAAPGNVTAHGRDGRGSGNPGQTTWNGATRLVCRTPGLAGSIHSTGRRWDRASPSRCSADAAANRFSPRESSGANNVAPPPIRSRNGRPAAENASTSGTSAESRASITTGRGSIPQAAARNTACTAAQSPPPASSSSETAARS